VHATGGLRDTVVDFDPWAGTGCGWTFSPCDAAALQGALGTALATYKEHPDAFEQLQRTGMSRNSSWDQAASQYEQIFDWAMLDEPFCK